MSSGPQRSLDSSVPLPPPGGVEAAGRFICYVLCVPLVLIAIAGAVTACAALWAAIAISEVLDERID
jgi:hypothetical protein